MSIRQKWHNLYNDRSDLPPQTFATFAANSNRPRTILVRKRLPSNGIPYVQPERLGLDRVAGSHIFKRRAPSSKRFPPPKPSTPSSSKPSNSAEIKVIVVNNRLGIREEITASPTDTILNFKNFAALYMGMSARGKAFILKKQGQQRPMGSFLTLADYEVEDGASLELEVDTREQRKELGGILRP
ncbi:MAG: hypothetical protein LQ350_004773 [Teloschistes chrysophthalmus]|nr:MAG: hypothetical protein LQ350_004773 [Niorma chrysophthalma]